MKRFFKGFTLAEVLITLGVIGIVAAVTLPTLNVDVNKQALSTQLQKNISQYTNAFAVYMQNEGLTELDSNFYTTANLRNFARTSLKARYICNDDDTNCFADNYTFINGGNGRVPNMHTFAGGDNTIGGILEDGTHFGIRTLGNAINPLYVLGLDVNGKKGPNTAGYDLFIIPINPDGSFGRSRDDIFDDSIDVQADIDGKFEACKRGTDANRLYGYGCFLHLQQNNFRYNY